MTGICQKNEKMKTPVKTLHGFRKERMEKKKLLVWTVLVASGLLWAQEEQKLDFAQVKSVEFTSHVNGKSAPNPEGASVVVGKSGIEINYVFPSAGHDACMAEFPVNIEKCNFFTVTFSVPAPGHRPFMVLTDRNYEKHYFALADTRRIAGQAITKSGTQTRQGKIAVANEHPGEYFEFRWGGDDNQKIDFPVKKLMLGINDFPDTFQGKGRITFHSMTFQLKNKDRNK